MECCSPFRRSKDSLINLFLVFDLSVHPVAFVLSRCSFLALSILLTSCNPYPKDYVVIIPSFVFLRVFLAWGNPYQKDSAIIVRLLFFPFVLSLHQVL